jgi:hypothetical protein
MGEGVIEELGNEYICVWLECVDGGLWFFGRVNWGC